MTKKHLLFLSFILLHISLYADSQKDIIDAFYNYLGTTRWEQAYLLSDQEISYKDFVNKYGSMLVVEVVEIKKIDNNEYQCIVKYNRNYDFGDPRNRWYCEKVTIQLIDNTIHIVNTEEIEFIREVELPYNNELVVFVENNFITNSLVVGMQNSMSLQIIQWENFLYDWPGFHIDIAVVNGDFFLFQVELIDSISNIETVGNIYDLKRRDIIDSHFYKIYATDDGKYIFSYADEGSDQGIMLEAYNGIYRGKRICENLGGINEVEVISNMGNDKLKLRIQEKGVFRWETVDLTPIIEQFSR